MKHFALAFALVSLPSVATNAADLRMTVEAPHFTCGAASHAMSRVAYRPGDQDTSASLPCCDGQLACAQFLSTNTVVAQPHEWHG